MKSISGVLDSFLHYRSEKQNDSRGVTLHLAFIVPETESYQGHRLENVDSHNTLFNDLKILVPTRHLLVELILKSP